MIAESCPFDILLARKMKASVNSLLQLNLKRFRVPQKAAARYSALDIVKQALELLYEFSPSQKSYREAMRTILVYSEGDFETFAVLSGSFRLIANAVYNAFSGQRHAESVAPDILFLQGIPFNPIELQRSFRFVGVKPPDVGPPTVKKIVFLDDGFEPYKLLLEGKLTFKQAEKGREEHWAELIESTLSNDGTALVRVGAEHVDQPRTPIKRLLSRILPNDVGLLPKFLKRKEISLKVIHRVPDVNEVFGKK